MPYKYRIPTKEIIEKRLLAKRKIDPETNCWLWTGGKWKHGYGHMTFPKRPRRKLVHRLAMWVYFDFDINKHNHYTQTSVCHLCDNKLCFNPEHLFLGTYKENNNDCQSKGRKTILKGEFAPNAKLTTSQVFQIDTRCKTGESYTTIAKDFKITTSMVGRIYRGVSWKRLKRSYSVEDRRGKYTDHTKWIHIGKSNPV